MLSWTNQELGALCKTPDLETEFKRGTLEALGHVIGMDHSRIAKNIPESKTEGKVKVGMLILKWLGDVENDSRDLKVKILGYLS
jgi:hypothetical protein